MFRIILVGALAVVSLSHVTSGFNTFRYGDFPLGRTGDLREMCQWFCVDTDYSDIFFRTMDNIMHPRIFCGICTKKLSTTGKPTTTGSSTTIVTTTTSPSTTPMTTKPPASTPAIVPVSLTTLPPPAQPVATEPATTGPSNETPSTGPETP